MRHIVILMSVAIALSGCSASPALDDSKMFWDNVREIKVGMSVADVSALIGPPHNVTIVGNVERRTYRYTALNGQYNWVTIPVRDGKVLSVMMTSPEGTIR